MDNKEDFDEKFLFSLIESDEDTYTCEPMSQTRSMNPVDAKVWELERMQLKNCMSQKNVTEVAKLMNSIPGTEFLLPEKANQLRKRVPVPAIYKCFVVCHCQTLLENNKMCDKCKMHAKINSKKNDFIVFFPIVEQIKKILSDKYDVIMKQLNREHHEGVICDIDDGTAFKQIQNKYPNSKLLSLTLNTDGAQVRRSSKNSLWITQLYQNYLPPEIRYRPENILISSLFYGPKKPDPMLLFSPLAKELDECEITYFDGENLVDFKPAIVTVSCDLPARAIVQNMVGPVGKYGCPVCLHPGNAVANLKNRTTIRYLKENEMVLRTHDETVIEAAGVANGPIHGIKGLSCMLLFDYFDIIDYFAIDFMHGAGLGVEKHIVEIWLGIKKIPDPKNGIKYKLKNEAERKMMNQRMLQFKPLMHFRRKPRSIFEVANYKASELINFLFYYSRFIALNLLPTKVIKHMELLSASIFILCKPSLTFEEIYQADSMLNKFCNDFEIIYGPGAVTMNIHLLRHYARSYLISGPIWANSLFAFESNIGRIKNLVSGNTDILLQISEKYAKSTMFHTDTENIPNDSIENEKLSQAKEIEISEDYDEVFNRCGVKFEQNRNLTIYRRLNLNEHTYTSSIAKEIKSVDYFIEMNDGSIGAILLFTKVNDECMLILNKYEIVYAHYHISEVRNTKKSDVYLCKDIKKKLLFLKCSGIEYIITEPQKLFFMS